MREISNGVNPSISASAMFISPKEEM